VGFSSPRRSSRRGSSFDDSIFEDIIRGKKQSLGNGYFDDAGVWVPGLKPFRSQESLNDDSFGKSFLRGPGLFSRKRKESSEKSLNKSGRGNIKSKSEVTGECVDDYQVQFIWIYFMYFPQNVMTRHNILLSLNNVLSIRYIHILILDVAIRK